MRPIYLNGKFYSGVLNGVHRVSDRLIRECDALLAATAPGDRPQVRLLLPIAEKRQWAPELHAIEAIECKGAHSQYWEQFLLPRLAADGVLVNLANLAPLLHRRQLLMVHDAQFLFPDSSYPWRQRIGYRLLVPRMARRSETVLTVSNYSRQMLDLLEVCARARSSVLYNGADHIGEVLADSHALVRLGLANAAYALMFGSRKEYKNNRIVFDAFADGALAPLKLAIVGAERADLERSGLHPPTDAIFVGKCEDAVLRALYEHAHCLLFPSRTEGFGLPPVEAMMCGCPVVVAPAGAMPEVCRDAALYADVDDPASWRAAITELNDPKRRMGKIAAGQERASVFTWAATGQQLWTELLRLASD